MDKKSVLAIILIMIIMTIWTFYISIRQAPQPVDDTQKAEDTTKVTNDSVVTEKTSFRKDTAEIFEIYGEHFAKFVGGKEDIITIENDLVKVRLTSKGATLLKYTLKNFKTWDGFPSQLIWAKGGTPSLRFYTREIKNFDDRNLNYTFEGINSNFIRIQGNDSIEIIAKLEIAPNRFVQKRYVFYGDKYHFHNEILLNNLEDELSPKGVTLQWYDGLRYQEQNSIDESSEAMIVSSFNDAIFELDASSDEPQQASPSGKLDFVAVKNKYFTAAIIPKPFQSYDGTVRMYGYREFVQDEGVIEKYNFYLDFPYRGGILKRNFDIYIGPIDYGIVKEYGITAVVNFGWRIIVRPIGEFFMLPIFKLIYKFVGNYGISIIIFALLMKFILYPLSISQMRSAQRMQLLAPEMQKIREQYKDDPQKQQQAILRLYSEYGINPMGGCLPLLLQLPILYALWAVLRTAIELRQAPFILWITDLSLPDYILNMPFPILGIKHISGLAVLMGVTLFLQQKLTLTDPRQKAMIYILPIMFIFLFSNFPSGLNLYYFMFNLFSIAHQVYLNKYSKKRLTLADLKKMPKKESWLQRKIREAQEIAEAQGRRITGQARQQQRRTQPKKKKK